MAVTHRLTSTENGEARRDGKGREAGQVGEETREEEEEVKGRTMGGPEKGDLKMRMDLGTGLGLRCSGNCVCKRLGQRPGQGAMNALLPAARGPAAPGSRWHIPGHSAGLEAAHQVPLLGGKLLPVPRAAG